MATHSSILALKIPWTEEPGGLQTLGLQRSWTQLSMNACAYSDECEVISHSSFDLNFSNN